MRIQDQKNGKLNEADRLILAQLLVKAGYTVRIGKEKPQGKQQAVIFVETVEAQS